MFREKYFPFLQRNQLPRLSETERAYRFRQCLGIVSLTSCLSVMMPYANDIKDNVAEVPSIVADAVTPSCDAPSPQATEATEAILYGPLPEARAEIQAMPRTSFTVLANEAVNLRERRVVAEDLGLTMHNANPTLGQLDQLQRYHDPSELAEVAAPFLAQYGITDVELATKADLFDENWKTINESDYRFERNINIMTLVKTVAALPEEYVKMTGITRIAFAKSADSDDSLAFVVASKHNETANQTMVLNSSKFIGDDTFKHELFHKIDALICGGGKEAANDPAFSRLTIPYVPHQKSPEPPKALTIDEYDRQATRLNYSINWQGKQCAAEVRDAQSLLTQYAARTRYASEYGRRGGVVEAKAELFEDDSNYISPRLGAMRKQLVLLLARLYERDAKLGTFMSSFYRDRLEAESFYADREPNLTGCDIQEKPEDNPPSTIPVP